MDLQHLLIWQGGIFAVMLLGHALADSVFQPSRLAVAKRYAGVRGWGALALHGSMHGIFVGTILLSPTVGVLEMIAHALIDWGKCRGYYGLIQDQGAHVICKLAWIIIWGGNAVFMWSYLLAWD